MPIIDISVGKADPALDVRRVLVRAGVELAGRERWNTYEVEAVTTGIFVIGEEHGAPAIFAGNVKPEVVTGVIAEAETEQRRALDVPVVDDEVVGLEFFGEDVADMRIGSADKALEIPRTPAADAELQRRR